MQATPSHRPVVLAALSAALLLAGCTEGAKHDVAPPRPTIQSFTATPASVAPGGSTTLAWSVTGADVLRITPGLGQVTGSSYTLVPVETTTYVLTATNTRGSATATVTVNVGIGPPTNLSYSTNPATYPVGLPIAPNRPSSSGGPPTGYAVTPALPAGLSLDPGTGIITGTPTTPAATATYTVTASNGSGSATAALVLTVSARNPPAGLSYSTNPATYEIGVAIAPNTPSSTGGAITSYSVAPALPAGLSLDATTGVITGTPTTATPTAAYTVTGANAEGNTTVALTLTVTAPAPPAGLAYPANPAVYTVGVAIAPNVPTSTGGVVSSWSIAPPLPQGLAFDTATGTISGTPTAGVTASYVVTATNPSGSATVDLVLTVNAAPPPGAPTIRSFTATPSTIADGSPTTLSWDVLDATDLVIEPFIGGVTGQTSLEFSPTRTTTFTLTATNALGTSTSSTTVTVTYLPPSNLRYTVNPATYVRGTPVAPNLPSWEGGVVFSFSVSPALPAGLVLDTATGILSGTPTAVASAASYTVTATNPGGSTTASLSITVDEAAPPAITVQPGDQAARKGAAATFGVTATGYPPLTYQWSRGGTAISGAVSASYTTPPLGAADDGASFTVTVTDGLSRSVASDPAVVLLRGFFPTGSLATGRYGHTATLLANGKVLVAGGNSGSASVASAEIYDPATGQFTATGSMASPRQGHAAVALASGKVLVAGGCIAGTGDCTSYLATAEIYDPATGAFTATGSLSGARTDFASAPLPDGRVLVAGGFRREAGTSVFLASAELFDPAAAGGAGAFAATGNMAASRRYPAFASLQDGRVLVVGGVGVNGIEATAEIYDPLASAFATTGSMSSRRQWASATRLDDGQVVVAGGSGPSLLTSAERFDPASGNGTFAATGSLRVARALQTATLLPEGDVIVAGGQGGGATTELYDSGAGVFSLAPPMAVARSQQTATRLADGTVLVVGGTDGSQALRTAERWGPDL